MAQRISSNKYGRRGKTLFTRNGTGAPLTERTDCPVWERVSQSYALLILTVFPLLIGPRTYYDITDTKFILFAVLTGLYLVSCLGIGFLYFPGKRRGRYLRERRGEKFTLPQLLLLAYVLWSLLSAVLSPYTGLLIGQSRYEGVLSLLLYSTAFLLLSFWGEYTDSYFWGLGVMGTVLGLIALLQSFGSKMIYPGNSDYWERHFLSTIGHEDCVAGIISILVPTLLCAWVLLEGKLRRLCLPGLFFLPYIAVFTDVDTAKMGLLVAVLMLPWLFETRERLQRLLFGLAPILLGFALGFCGLSERSFAPGKAALLFLLLAAASAGAGWMMSRKERSWSVRPVAVRRAAYALMLLALAAALVLVYRYGGDNRLLTEASELLHGRLSDEAGSLRGYIWKSTWELIWERPIFGGGPGSFAGRFSPYNPGYMVLIQEPVTVDFPHNDFLAVAASSGFVGLALYLAFLTALFVRCLRAVKRCPLLLIFVAGLLGYLAYAFFVFSIAIVSPLFWVLAGLADHVVRQLKSETAETPAA